MCSLEDPEDKQIIAMPKKIKPGMSGTASPINPRIMQMPPITMSKNLASDDTESGYHGC